MPIELHTVESPDGCAFANADRVIIGRLNAVANLIGGGAGLSVATVIAGLNLPANYQVIVEVGQDATAWVSAKTSAGFTVNLVPRLAANTLAAGTFNALIVA
jgi:hypothetical protein